MATTVTVSQVIDAPASEVFQAVSDVPNIPNTVPDIIGVEILGDVHTGVGTKFRETRVMGKKKNVTELEITEYEENDHVRMVADSHGTVWDTIFTVQSIDDGRTELTISMEARPHKLLPKLLNPIMKGLFRKGLAAHLDAVKEYCEQLSLGSGGDITRP